MEAYDQFSSDYDRFVNWKSRLGFELPFIEQKMARLGVIGRPVRVLDAACGTGMHAVVLAQKGYAAAGADLSAGMVSQAQVNAAAAGVSVPFVAAGFGALEPIFQDQKLLPFDAVLCLGNSLPHLLTSTALVEALADFAACLRPGGLLLVQSRNFDAVMAQLSRWMEPQAHREGDREWVFLRFYDFLPDGLLQFNIVTLKRQGDQGWTQSITETLLRPLLQDELGQALAAAGFGEITWFGDLAGSAFDQKASGNLVFVAQKR